MFFSIGTFFSDKFSGFDRVEGGTRANLGVRYTGTFDNGFGLRALVGQSYHIGGVNSFATADLLNVGADSGLETDVSDFVAMGGIDTPFGVSLSTSVRLDEKTLELRRTDVSASVSQDRYQASVTFTQLEAQPEYGFTKDNQAISTSSSLKVSEYWSVFGGVNYDIDDNKFSSRAIGISYADECTVLSISYSDTYDPDNETANDWTVMGRLTFRTLGDIQLGTQ